MYGIYLIFTPTGVRGSVIFVMYKTYKFYGVIYANALYWINLSLKSTPLKIKFS